MLQFFPKEFIDDTTISKNKTWSSLQIISSYTNTFVINTATGTNSISSGIGSKADGENSITFGKSAQSVSDGTVTIGYNASVEADSDYSIAIGSESSVTGASGIAVGHDAVAYGDYALAFGPDSSAAGKNSIAIGNGAYATQNSIAIGNSAGTTDVDTIVFATSTGDTTYHPAEGTTPEKWTGSAGDVVTKFTFTGGDFPSLGAKVYQLNTATTGTTILDVDARLEDIIGFPARMKQISTDEIRVTVGDEDYTWNWCEINSAEHLITGFVDGISIKCSSAGGSGSNLYLAIWQHDGTYTTGGEKNFEFVGVSQNSANYTAGGTMDYIFNDVSLTSRDVRLYPITQAMKNAGTYKSDNGASLSTRTKYCSDGCYIHVDELGDDADIFHAPDVTFSVYDNFLSGQEFRELSSGDKIVTYGVDNPSITMEHNTWFQLTPSSTSVLINTRQNTNGVVKSFFKVTPTGNFVVNFASGVEAKWHNGVPYFAANKTYVISAIQISATNILMDIEYAWD